jgi:segregation and condensation protein B
MDKQQLRQIIEAAILTHHEPLSVDKLLALFVGNDSITKNDITAELAAMEEAYADNGFMLKRLASGYVFQARQKYSPWLEHMFTEKPQKYGRAFLETLAIIAYRQPVTRADIEDIRGVAVSTHIIKTLQDREWIKVVGHRDVPGKPAIFGTTKVFLDYFNLTSLEELPSLQDVIDLDALAAKLDPQLALEIADHGQENPDSESSTEQITCELEQSLKQQTEHEQNNTQIEYDSSKSETFDEQEVSSTELSENKQDFEQQQELSESGGEFEQQITFAQKQSELREEHEQQVASAAQQDESSEELKQYVATEQQAQSETQSERITSEALCDNEA